jgi:Undecaprenyl-phosphate galactose phosphotransferase WbaP
MSSAVISNYGNSAEVSRSVSGRAVPYERLELLDRHAAETLNRFCKANVATSATATHLADVSAWQSIWTSIPLAVSDFVSLYASLILTTFIYAPFLNATGLAFRGTPALFVALTIFPMAQLSGLYPGLGLSSPVEFRQIVRSLFAALLVFAVVSLFFLPNSLFFITVTACTTFIIAVPGMLASRYIVKKIASRFLGWGVPVFIVAEPERAYEFFRRLASQTEQGFRPVGVLLDPEQYWDVENFDEIKGNIPTFDIRSADQSAREHSVTWVVVSPCANRSCPSLDPSIAAIPNRLLLSSAQLDLGMWDRLYSIGNTTGLHCIGRPNSFKLFAKRALDLTLTLAAMIASIPALLFICLCIKFSSSGPIFYSQKRIGRFGKQFNAWKFRTMQVNADKVLARYLASNKDAQREWDATHKLANDPRVTWIGKWLRATSMDEIPQLWNVLRGEMSLVGPRPIINSPIYDACYVEKYPEEFETYKTVRPGLTGLWQVRCRNRGVYDLRIYWDMYYVRNWSIWLDLYLILRTVKTVFFREGS